EQQAQTPQNQPQPVIQQGPQTPQSQPQQAVQKPQEQEGKIEEQEEKIDLEEITDIGDILSSFKDNEIVSPYLLALSQGLDDIDAATLITRCRRVTASLVAASTPIGSLTRMQQVASRRNT